MPDPDNDELGVWDAGDDLGPIPPRDPQTALVRHAATISRTRRPTTGAELGRAPIADHLAGQAVGRDGQRY
jgi:hypothetical protein